MTARIGYGDSCQTGDDKYVLAQFRADASLEWVVDLRKYLQIPELKYKVYSPHKQRVASNAELQRQVNRGLAQAEITIIDRPWYSRLALWELINSGAEFGYDFMARDVHERAADNMLLDSPLSVAGDTEFDWMTNYTGTTLSRTWSGSDKLTELPRFDPSTIRKRAGGKLRDVVVVAARAHSMLSPTEKYELRMLALKPHRTFSFPGNRDRIASMSRVFDTEHAKSVPILNEFVDRVDHMTHPHGSMFPRRLELAVTEASSSQSDHLQAADFAAGWAADLLVSTNSDYRVLASKVRWAGVNGITIPA